MTRILLSLLILFLCSLCYGEQSNSKLSDTLRINNDLKIITQTEKARNYQNIKTLNFVAQYIFDEFVKTCDTVYYQPYLVDGVEYKNVIGQIGAAKKEKVIIGAHYDVAGNQKGADDNASGVVGLLELARLISNKDSLKFGIEFVAYTLEEPPFFRTEYMGSYIHAKSLFDDEVSVKGMICLEMIGYFDDKPKSQEFPVGLLKLFYGNTGDFITIVQKFSSGKFARNIKNLIKKQGLIKTKVFQAPSYTPGIDLSDHRNYWKYGYSAIMITDTAFYRNKNYHKSTDTMDTLDLKRMALVIDQVYLSLKALS